MRSAHQPYSSLSGVADGSQVRHELIEKLHEIGGSTAIAITCIEEGTLDELRLALRDVTEATRELPRLEARVLNWERVWGSLRPQALARAGR